MIDRLQNIMISQVDAGHAAPYRKALSTLPSTRKSLAARMLQGWRVFYTYLFCYIPTVYQCRPMCTNHNTYIYTQYTQYTQCTLYFLGLFGYSQRLGCLGFGFTPFTKHSTWRTDRSFKHSLDVESNSSWHSTKMLKSCQHGMTDTSRPR